MTDDKPKRPLSAYNLFFRHTRKQMLEEEACNSRCERLVSGSPSSGRREKRAKIGFAALARTVSSRWIRIDPSAKQHFEKLAAEDKARYDSELKEWKAARLALCRYYSEQEIENTKEPQQDSYDEPDPYSLHTSKSATCILDADTAELLPPQLNTSIDPIRVDDRDIITNWSGWVGSSELECTDMKENFHQEASSVQGLTTMLFNGSYLETRMLVEPHSIPERDLYIERLATVLDVECLDFFVAAFH